MEFHEVVRLVSTVSTHASKVLSEALAKPRTGDWLALVDDEALQAHSAMEQALREVRELKRKVSEDAQSARFAAPHRVLSNHSGRQDTPALR